MRSAKLLIVAYKAYKRNQPDIAAEVFAEAMEDDSAPELMEELFKHGVDDEATAGDELVEVDDDNDDDNDNDDLDTGEEDEPVEDEDTPPVLSQASIQKLRGIANRIAAEDKGAHRDIAKKLLKTIRTFERK